MKAIGINDLVNFNFIDKPKIEYITKSLDILKMLKAITIKVKY